MKNGYRSAFLWILAAAICAPAFGASATLLPAYSKQHAEDAIARQDWRAAEGALLATIRIDYKDAVAHSELGSVYLHLGQRQRAGEEFRIALRLHPHLQSAEDGLDASFENQAQRDAYFDGVKQQVAANPKDVNALTTLAELDLDRGDIAGARTQAVAALAIDPAFGHAHCVMGRIEARAGNYDAAHIDFEAAVKYDRNDDDAWAGLGDIAMMHHDATEAIACYRHSVAAAPDHAQWHTKLASALTAAGDGQGAARETAQATTLSAPLPQASN